MSLFSMAALLGLTRPVLGQPVSRTSLQLKCKLLYTLLHLAADAALT